MFSHIFLFVLLFATDDSIASSVVDGDCSLWLAPSYINVKSAEYPKYGLIAGKTYEENSNIPMSDLAIPLVDFFGNFNRKKPYGSKVLDFLENFVWTEQKVGSQYEGNITSPGFVPGIGILANYHSTFSNADITQASILLRERENEFRNHGEANLLRGAVTNYFNATLQVTRKIPAGMEIFPNYGDVWDGNFSENLYQDKLYRYDYDLADEIVKKLNTLYDKHPKLSIDLKEDIMEFMLQKVLTTVTGANAKVISSLIPENPRKLKLVEEAGGTFMYRFRDMIRSNEWLSDKGICLDTLRQGISQIKNAGRGAFANRDIRKGEIITVTPVIHVVNKDLLNMYRIVETENEMGDITQDYDESDGVIGKQILLNYVFEHPESSMIFIPTGPFVNLINNGGYDSNSRVEWASSEDRIANPDEYLQMSVEEMSDVKGSVLIMKVIANRNINEGDEITMNYGDSWQKTWEEYRENWKRIRNGKPHPLKADDLREIYASKPYETIESVKDNPYPDTVFSACFLLTEERPDGTLMVNQDYGTEINQFIAPVHHNQYDSKILYKVEFLDRKEAPDFLYNYTVRAFIGESEYDFAEVLDVPHKACTFFDYPYTSDIHLPDAFRHPIGMPDSQVPDAWRNLNDS